VGSPSSSARDPRLVPGTRGVAYTHRYTVVAGFVVFSLAWAWVVHERPPDAERRQRPPSEAG